MLSLSMAAGYSPLHRLKTDALLNGVEGGLCHLMHQE